MAKLLILLGTSMSLMMSSGADPCSTAELLGYINQRVVGYTLRDDEFPISDFRLQKGWYKLPTGYTLASTPEPCGTYFNWWLSDTLPTVGTAVLTVCQNFLEPCTETKQINVQSCAEEHVYALTPTASDLEAYCIEKIGQIKPDPAPDISSLKPVIVAEVTRQKADNTPLPKHSLEFYCKFELLDNSFKDFIYDFEWNLHSGGSKLNSLLTVKNVEYKNNNDFFEKAKLTEDNLKDNQITKPGFTLSCSVKARTSSSGRDSDIIDSLPQFFGIKILTPTTIRVLQDQTFEVQFQLTMPFGCIVSGCSLELHMVVPDETTGKCELSNLVQELPTTGRTCGFSFQSDGDIATFEVSATFGANKATPTGRVYDLFFTTHDTNHNHKFFENYLLPSIRVELLVDQKILHNKWCHSVSDPHMRTHDGRTYDHHSTGAFILYRHTKLQAEVQTMTKSCYNNNRPPHCNCGVVVRAGRDIFEMNNCERKIQPPRIVQCNDGVLQKRIRRKNNVYEIDLPHGVKVKLVLHWRNFVNVYIYPTLTDFKESEGLCGYFDNNRNNDFKHREGSTGSFKESWRASETENLFKHENHITTTEWLEDLYFCDCFHTNNFLNGDTQCSSSRTCTNDIGNIRDKICDYQVGRKKRDVHGTSYDAYTDPTTAFISSNEKYSIISGTHFNPEEHSVHKRQSSYTNETALAECLHLMNTPVFQICDQIPDLDINGIVNNCVQDAVMTNSMNWTMQHLESIKQTCTEYVTVMQPLPQEIRDLLVVLPDANSTEDYNGTYEYPPLPPLNESSSANPITTEMFEEIVAMTCPNECNYRGLCINGICQCDEPYSSFDCSIDNNQAPVMVGIPDRGECDLQNRACVETAVLGTNIAETKSLTCRTTLFKINSKGNIHVGQSSDVPGNYESMFEVYCPLPESRQRRSVNTDDTLDDIISYGYQTSLSNDGKIFSEVDTIVIYDSLCVHCTKIGADIVCTKKDGYCLNGGRCYMPGESVGCYTCSHINDEWKSGPDCPTKVKTNGIKGWIIGIICGAVAGVFIVVSVICYVGKRK